MRKVQFAATVAGLSFLAVVSPARSQIVANSVVSYDAEISPTITPQFIGYMDPSTSLGTLQGDTSFGGMSPFNPPFLNTQITAIGPGGELTLQMSAPVATDGRTLGVFSNAGLNDGSFDGSGQADANAQTLDEAFGETDPEAIVSVSDDGTTFIPLNSGKPILFLNPSNYYLDESISSYDEPLGTQVANQFEPFLGTLSDFNGLNFDQIKTLLGGSAGGNWLDLSTTGLSQVNYVRFAVPAGADYGMAVDSVSAVPEPVVALPLLIIAGATLRRRARTT